MIDALYWWAVGTVIFTGGACILGVGLLVSAICLDGLWRWWGWGQKFVAFCWWEAQAGTVRIQHFENGEWVTAERLPKQYRRFFSRAER